jgi:hypothetical protein
MARRTPSIVSRSELLALPNQAHPRPSTHGFMPVLPSLRLSSVLAIGSSLEVE